MFPLKSEDKRMTWWTLFQCIYCQLWTYFTPFSSVSMVDIEQVNVWWFGQNLSYTEPFTEPIACKCNEFDFLFFEISWANTSISILPSFLGYHVFPLEEGLGPNLSLLYATTLRFHRSAFKHTVNIYDGAFNY